VEIQTLFQYGVPPIVVAVIFMFKLYVDARRNKKDECSEMESLKTEVKTLRQDLYGRERREEIKPLANAISALNMAVHEIHIGQQQQTKVLEALVSKLS